MRNKIRLLILEPMTIGRHCLTFLHVACFTCCLFYMLDVSVTPNYRCMELLVVSRINGRGGEFLYVCMCCTFKLFMFTHIFEVSSRNPLSYRNGVILSCQSFLCALFPSQAVVKATSTP